MTTKTLSTFALVALFGAGPLVAWTPDTQVIIAREAGHLAPPDLARQIERHKRALAKGALAPFRSEDPTRHRVSQDGGILERVLRVEVEAAIREIQEHRPFAEIVFRLGVISHYIADANNPLNTSGADRQEGSYYEDFLLYAESALPRFPLIFYGLDPALSEQGDLDALLATTVRRGRQLYPLVGREYRRVSFVPGVESFDDRSTAFGVASVSFSRSVSDVLQVLRYIWLEAGGVDSRAGLPEEGERLLQLPRVTPNERKTVVGAFGR